MISLFCRRGKALPGGRNAGGMKPKGRPGPMPMPPGMGGIPPGSIGMPVGICPGMGGTDPAFCFHIWVPGGLPYGRTCSGKCASIKTQHPSSCSKTILGVPGCLVWSLAKPAQLQQCARKSQSIVKNLVCKLIREGSGRSAISHWLSGTYFPECCCQQEVNSSPALTLT